MNGDLVDYNMNYGDNPDYVLRDYYGEEIETHEARDDDSNGDDDDGNGDDDDDDDDEDSVDEREGGEDHENEEDEAEDEQEQEKEEQEEQDKNDEPGREGAMKEDLGRPARGEKCDMQRLYIKTRKALFS
jgi:hypothetical protein